MCIRHLFSIDKVIPVCRCIASFFGRYYYNVIYPGEFLKKPHISLLISTIKVLPYLMILHYSNSNYKDIYTLRCL